MRRRQFLAGSLTVPALGAGIATAAIVRDPHPEWVEQWRRARDDWDKAAQFDDNGDGPACMEAYRREMLLRDRIVKTEARTQEGIDAQIAFLAEEFGDELDLGETFLASICGEFA